jgi:SSS family solute:Na+ symporter
MHPVDLTIASLYVLGVLGLGFAVSRQIHGFRDFFVAGGRMTPAILICTLVSTYYGLDVLFGGSEVGYIDGVVGWFYYTRPYYVAILLAAFLLAARLKRFDFLSLPDVAERFYGRGTQAVIAGASFVYSLPLLAMMGIGVLLDVMMGIPFHWGVVAGAVLSLAYTLMGGLLADALTDTVQFTLMCAALGIAAFLVLPEAGGLEGLQRVLPETYFDPRGTYPLGVLLVFSLAALSVLVEPAFYQRIFAAESARAVFIALAVGIVIWAAYDWIVTLMGMAAQARGIVTEPRYALLTLTLDVLPVGLRGLFVAAVIATAMSTIDSYLLIAGGNVAYDLYRPLFRPDLGDRELLSLTRWSILAACAVSIFFALFFQSMVSAWVFMSTVLISAALVPILAGLYLPSRYLRPAAGMASSLAGLFASVAFVLLVNVMGAEDPEWGTVIWRATLWGWPMEIWQEYAVLVALPLSVLGFMGGHLFGRPRERGEG